MSAGETDGPRILLVGPERMRKVIDIYPASLRPLLLAEGIEPSHLEFVPTDHPDQLDLAAVRADTTDLLVFSITLPTSAWEGLTELRRVGKMGRIRPGIDRAALDARGIPFEQFPDRRHVSVSEHALMFMLTCARRLPDAMVLTDRPAPAGEPDPVRTSNNVRRANWRSLDGTTFRHLDGSTLGIIGLGEIGFQLGVRAAALGMEVSYFNRHRLPAEIEAAIPATYRSKEELLRTSSFVALTSAVAEGDGPALDRDDVALLRDDAIVVNVGTGSALDQAAILERSRRAELGGLGLDVFSVEPCDPAEFAGLRNVVLTSHVGGQMPTELRFHGYVRWLTRQLRPSAG